MNYKQMHTFFDECCHLYAEEYGSGSFPLEYKTVTLLNIEKKDSSDPRYIYKIIQWDHDSPKPTEYDLMKYTFDEVRDYHARKELIKQLNSHVIPTFTETQLNKTKGKDIKNGVLIYNATLNCIMVFINGNWEKI